MPSGTLGGRKVRLIPPGTTIHPHHGLLRPDLAVQESGFLRGVFSGLLRCSGQAMVTWH